MPASSSKSKANLSASPKAPVDKVIAQEKIDDKVEAVEQENVEKSDSAEESVDDKDTPVLFSKEIGVEGGDDVDKALEKEHADNLRRKRDREGSLEPSLSSQQGTTTQDTIPAKKNRLQDGAIREEQAVSSSVATPSSPSLKGGEGEKVGHIRKRVQDLSWKQRKEGDRDALDEDKDFDETSPVETSTVAEKVPAPTTKRTQPSFSSYSSKPSAFASAKKEGAASPPAISAEADKMTSSPPNGRTQPTFSSFSKSSSPFNSMSSVAGPSWLAGKSGSGSPASSGGIRPSALGSVGSPSNSSTEGEVAVVSAVKEDRPASQTAPASSSSKQLGFGAFATSKAFAPRGSTPTASTDKQVNGDDSEESSAGKSFDEVLKQGKNHEDDVIASKVSTQQLQPGHADLKTGEEDERTLTSARGKLYTMTEDKNWKERGTGTVRCNIAKERESSARLVMRSEGVLRLILNINLFKGMKINLEQDKFLRIVALEDEKLVHFAIKFANQATATNFYRVVTQTIPSDEQWDSDA